MSSVGNRLLLMFRIGPMVIGAIVETIAQVEVSSRPTY